MSEELKAAFEAEFAQELGGCDWDNSAVLECYVWFLRGARSNPAASPDKNHPASLSSQESATTLAPDDAQIASMNRHAAPVDAQDGGASPGVGGLSGDEQIDILLKAYNESVDDQDDAAYANGGHMEVAYYALQRALAQRSVGWRPISEAPRDGTAFLAWADGYWENRPVLLRWEDGRLNTRGLHAPTHFQPLPPPPTNPKAPDA